MRSVVNILWKNYLHNVFAALTTYSQCIDPRFESGGFTSLWWSISTGATVSQSCGGSNALVFGTNLTERIATTRPVVIPSTPTTPILLYEGFNDNNSTRLMEEG